MQKSRYIHTHTKLLAFVGAILFVNTAIAACYNDFECGMGNKCVKATGDINVTGVCVKPSDQFGNPRPDYSPPQSEPKKVRGCSFDTDCGIGFSCLKRNGQIYGICIK